MSTMTNALPLQILGRSLIGGIVSHVIWGIIYSQTLHMVSGATYPGHIIIIISLILGLIFGVVNGAVMVIVTGVVRQEKYSRAIVYFSTCVMFAVFFFYMHLISSTWWQLLINTIIGIVGSWYLTNWVLGPSLEIGYTKPKRQRAS